MRRSGRNISGSINEIEEEVVGIIKLPPDWRNGRRVTLMAAYREEYKKSYAISTAKLGRLENEVSYYVENCHREGSQITVTGWCMSAGDIKLELLGRQQTADFREGGALLPQGSSFCFSGM